MPLTPAEQEALDRTRAIVAAPPQEIRRADAAVLVAALDRATSEGPPGSVEVPDLPTVAASLRRLIEEMNAGEIKDHTAVRQRLTGAVIALELLAGGDDLNSVQARLLEPSTRLRE